MISFATASQGQETPSGPKNAQSVLFCIIFYFLSLLAPLLSPRFSHDKRGICHSQGQFCEVEREEEEGKEASDEREAVFLPPPSSSSHIFFWGKENGEYGRERGGGGGIERPLSFTFAVVCGKKAILGGLPLYFIQTGQTMCVPRNRLPPIRHSSSFPVRGAFLRKRCHLFLAVSFPPACAPSKAESPTKARLMIKGKSPRFKLCLFCSVNNVSSLTVTPEVSMTSWQCTAFCPCFESGNFFSPLVKKEGSAIAIGSVPPPSNNAVGGKSGLGHGRRLRLRRRRA